MYYIGNLTEKYLHRGRFQRMVTNALDAINQLFIGIGGSDDFLYYYIKFLYIRIFSQKFVVVEEDKKLKHIDENIAIIHFDSKIDMFGDMDATTSLNYFKKIYHHLKEAGFKSKVIFMGVQSLFCPHQIIDGLEEEKDHTDTEVIWMRKDIRTAELTNPD